jgi:arylsulfatase A-like enzyme
MKLKQLLLIPILVFALAGDTAIASENSTLRPNILWVVSEDNSPFLGCYGDEYAVTPNLDKLATSGVIYTNAFATSPVCAPARFTLATGIYVNTAGTENMRSRNPVPVGIKFLSNYMREAGYYCTNNSKEDYNTIKPDGAWDESSNKATYRNRATGQPFFHIQNFHTTHESRLHRGSEPDLHDPAEAPVPAYHPDIPVIRADWAVYYDRVTEVDAEIGAFLKQVEEDGLLDNTIVFYYSDHGGALARSKRFLFESGLRVPLIVHVPKKWRHLAPGPDGSATDRLVTFIDLPPTVLSLAGVTIPEHMQGQAFLGQSEGEPREYAYSQRGRMDERMDRSRTIRDKQYRYTRNWMPFRPYGQFIEYLWRAPTTKAWEAAYRQGDVTAEQSVFFNPSKPGEELYDCLEDPDNINNLVGDPAYQATLSRMRAALDKWVLETRDSGLLPEGEFMMRTRNLDTTGYAYVRSDDYPLDDLLHAANVASAANNDDIPELMKLSLHPDSGVRYWIATAYLNLGKDCQETRKMLKRLLDDLSPDVRIAAAEALYKRGEADLVQPVLEAALQHPEEMVRVHALNALSFMEPDFVEGFIPFLRKLTGDKKEARNYDIRAAEHLISLYGTK